MKSIFFSTFSTARREKEITSLPCKRLQTPSLTHGVSLFLASPLVFLDVCGGFSVRGWVHTGVYVCLQSHPLSLIPSLSWWCIHPALGIFPSFTESAYWLQLVGVTVVTQPPSLSLLVTLHHALTFLPTGSLFRCAWGIFFPTHPVPFTWYSR